MLYALPPLKAADRALLEEIDVLRRRLGHDVGRARPWVGTLRRQARASTTRSSTEIEGFRVTEQEALALVEGEAVAHTADREAVAGYALAMAHVAVLADDPSFRWSDRLVLDLHFEACWRSGAARPGRWRTGPVQVVASSGVVYVAPDADDVATLMAEMVDWLQAGDLDAHPVIRAAMAHLNVVSIHPFRDGNGRISRVLQSLVLAREGVLAPELGSIEEYLARNTGAYYQALQQVQGGGWFPKRDATPWVQFCLVAHRAQAAERVAQSEAAARRWEALEALVAARGWPERLVIALERSLIGGADRAGYAREAGVSLATASGDLRRLVDAGLVERRGATQNARYFGSARL